MKIIGIILLIAGILFLLASGILGDMSKGTEIRFGYIQNGEYNITSQQTFGQDSEGLHSAKILQATGITSFVIGIAMIIVSIFQKKVLTS